MASRAGKTVNLTYSRCALAKERERVCLRRWYCPKQILGVQRFEGVLREPAAALSGVDGLACELLELFYGHHDGPSVPIRSLQIAGAVRGDVDAVAPASLTGGEKKI